MKGGWEGLRVLQDARAALIFQTVPGPSATGCELHTYTVDKSLLRWKLLLVGSFMSWHIR